MISTIQLPGGGYDIKVVRKEDIIDCIDTNIVDKDIALAIIEQIEVDATTFLKEGRWTTLPHIGTLRKNEYKEKLRSDDTRELIRDAKELLDKDKYILFRKNLKEDMIRSVKENRAFTYILSQLVKKNRKFFNYLIDKHGEDKARFIMYTLNFCTLYELQTCHR